MRSAAAAVPRRVLLPRRRSSAFPASPGSPTAAAWSTSTCGRWRSAPPCSSVLCALPILAKWVLIGRWKPQQIPVWSMAYLRFWIVKTLIQRNPLALFVGSPLYTFYLRALGAKVGRGVAILSRNVPVCTDLLTIGDGTVIRKDSFFTGYRAHDGRDPDGHGHPRPRRARRRGDGARHRDLARRRRAARPHLLAARRAGPCRPASAGTARPRQPTEVDYRVVRRRATTGALRRIVFSVVQLLNLMVLFVPLALGPPLPCCSAGSPSSATLLGCRGRRRSRAGRSTARRSSPPRCCSSGSSLVGLVVDDHRPAPARTSRSGPDKDLPPLRRPLLGPPGDRAG